jgi:hypothetical protein
MENRQKGKRSDLGLAPRALKAKISRLDAQFPKIKARETVKPKGIAIERAYGTRRAQR